MKNLLFLCLLLVNLLINPLWAGVPQTLSYQGSLFDNTGQAVSGTKSITFSLYTENAGGTPFWTDTQSVDLVEGRLSVELGNSTNPLDPSDFTGETYIGLKVGSDQEMPRQKFASVAYAFQAGDGGVPSGGIIMWSGSVNSIPDGWALCNGSNGTPDLRDRFVVGAGSGYAVGNRGGYASVNISHNHSITSSAPSTNSTGSHAHSMDFIIGQEYCYGDCEDGADDGSKHVGSDSHGHRIVGSTHHGGDHSHKVNYHSHGGLTGTTGSTSLNNRPPYYALAFIMKL
jgi:hypothetical protein